MKIELWCIGKTDEKYLQSGIKKYVDRLKHYTKYSVVEYKDVKATKSSVDTVSLEADLVLDKLSASDHLILLDEKGEMLTSVSFARMIENLQNRSTRKVVFLICGAYGADPRLRDRADKVLSLSAMTYSHQMVRLFIKEQIYRAYTIIRNEKYHNE